MAKARKRAAPVAPDEVAIENVAGVESVRFKRPQGGGMVLLTGDNGEGKSKSLEAIESLLGQDHKLKTRDGTLAGCVSGWGVTIRVSAAGGRRAGELTCTTLDDDLSIADLIDPKLKTPAAADAKRLRALLRVLRVPADVAKFYDLAGSEERFRAVVRSEVFEETDLIAQAALIKRDLDAAALEAEREAEDAERQAEILRESNRDVDTTRPDDDAALQAELEAAIRRHNGLKLRRENAEKSRQNGEQARERLEKAKAEYTGPTDAVATAAHELAAEVVREKTQAVAALELQLKLAKDELASAQLTAIEKKAEMLAASQHGRLLTELQGQIESADASEAPSDDTLRGAEEGLQSAREAVQMAATVRRAKEQLEQAVECEKDAAEATARALVLRDGARGVDTVLSELVGSAGSTFKVIEDERGDLRLAVPHAKRGTAYFHDLSLGEKVFVVVPLAIKAVGPGGAFVLLQEFFEGLSPHRRVSLVKLLQGSEVTCVTAIATDDQEVKALVFGGSDRVDASELDPNGLDELVTSLEGPQGGAE